MKHKNPIQTLSVTLSLIFLAAGLSFGAGEPSGNALYAEHFALGMIIDGVDGPATQSGMDNCGGGLSMMTGDSSGNFYFVSVSQNKIYWRAPSGVVRCIAGTGMHGFQDGPGDEARFSFGDGQYVSVQICCDQKGNIYVADGENTRFRKIYRLADSTWWVTTVAGGGTGWPTTAGIAADQLKMIPYNFSVLPDGSALYFNCYGLFRVDLTSNNASENRVYKLATTGFDVSEDVSWKSAAYVTTDSQFFWMPNDPGMILKFDLRTNIVDRYAGFRMHNAGYDGTSRFDAGFHTVLFCSSPSGEVQFTGCGDEAEVRRIYQDTVKHLLINGTYRRQTGNSGSWAGSAQFVDKNGYFYYWNTQGVSRMTFEGTDTTASHNRLAFLTITLKDSSTKEIIQTPAAIELVKNGNVIQKKGGSRGIYKMYADNGSGYSLNVSAASYVILSGFAVTMEPGAQQNLTIYLSRAPLTGIEITPAQALMGNNASLALGLNGLYNEGASLSWDNAIPVVWTSRTPSQISVSTSGVLTSYTTEGTCIVLVEVPSLSFKDSIEVVVRGIHKSPVYQWSLDENSGTVAFDVSGNANHANFRNSPVWTVGKFGSALSFDGTDDGLLTTTKMDPPQVFTLSLWFKSTSTAGGKLIGFGDDAGNYDREILMKANGTLNFWVYNQGKGGNSILTTESFNDGAWHHVAGVMGSSGLALYVDGVLKSTGTATNGDMAKGSWHLGYNALASWQGLASAYFNGTLDDIRIYDKALQSTDIASLQSDTGTFYLGQEVTTLSPCHPVFSAAPNPFNPMLNIRVNSTGLKSELKIIDMSGRIVANLDHELQAKRGLTQITWNASGCASGVYLISFKSGEVVQKKKVLLVR